MNPALAATCSTHPLSVATFTCSRCGSFACDACRSPAAPGQCLACEARTAPTLGVGATVAEGFRLVASRLPVVALFAGVQLALALTSLPMTLHLRERQLAGDTTPDFTFGGNLGTVLLSFLLGALSFAFISAMLVRAFGDVAEGRTRPVGEALREGASHGLPQLGLTLLQSVGIGAGMLLCLVPGLFLALAWSLATPALVLGGLGVLPSLRDSWHRTAGMRLRLLGVFLVALLGVVAASLVNLVLAPPVQGVEQARVIAAHLLSQAVSFLAIALLLAQSTAAYVRLRGPTGAAR